MTQNANVLTAAHSIVLAGRKTVAPGETRRWSDEMIAELKPLAALREPTADELARFLAGETDSGNVEDGQVPVEKPLDQMNHAELEAKAAELKVTFGENDKTKADRVKVLEAAIAAATAATDDQLG